MSALKTVCDGFTWMVKHFRHQNNSFLKVFMRHQFCFKHITHPEFDQV